MACSQCGFQMLPAAANMSGTTLLSAVSLHPHDIIVKYDTSYDGSITH